MHTSRIRSDRSLRSNPQRAGRAGPIASREGTTLATGRRTLLQFGIVAVAGMLAGAAPAHAARPAATCSATWTSVGRWCVPGKDPGCVCLFAPGEFECAYITENVLQRSVHVYFPALGEPVDGRADRATYFQAALVRRDGSVAAFGPLHYTPDWYFWWVSTPTGWVRQNTRMAGVDALYNTWFMDGFSVTPGEYWVRLGYALPGGGWSWVSAGMSSSGAIGGPDVNANGAVTYTDHCRFLY